MKRLVYSFMVVFLFCSLDQPNRIPDTKKQPITDTFYGQNITESYRWLEDWHEPEVKQWSKTQNTYARSYLDRLPGYNTLYEEIKELYQNRSQHYDHLFYQNDLIYALKTQPPLNQPLLVVLNGFNPESESVVYNPNQDDETGALSIDWYRPSPDGKFIAVSISKGGSESGDLYLFNTASNEVKELVIERVNGGTAGGDMAWDKNSQGFYYTRYPRAGERSEKDMNFYQQLWYHRLSTDPNNDRNVLNVDLPRIAEITVQVDNKTGQVLATVQNGDSGQFAHYLIDALGSILPLSGFDDKIEQIVFAPENRLMAISRHNAARGKIISMKRSNPNRHKTIIHQNEGSIVYDFYDSFGLMVTDDRIYIPYQTGGPSEIRSFDLNGHRLPGPMTETATAVKSIVAIDDNDILFKVSSYTEPPAWLLYRAKNNTSEKTVFSEHATIDMSDIRIVRTFAKSKDGTSIPISILEPIKLEKDGQRPVFLTGYGGFGVNNEPRFKPVHRVWLNRGGVVAIANIRGGGEFGETWHQAGMRTKKQNCFDDFAAAMQTMIDNGYTQPEKLAIVGGSNGGLLMGAMITQHPHLFRATVSTVGIYDMLRYQLSPNGAFNIPEYGSVRVREEFNALYTYSPYHNTTDSTSYPAVLFMTGENDPRVDPMHSRKMTARLQNANNSTNPVLLRTSSTTGHGGSTPMDEKIKELTDMYAFLIAQLQM